MCVVVGGAENVLSAERVLEHVFGEAETTGRALRVISAWTLPLLVR